jgi:tRNA 5-methylaminomethyl-2-thiouridine biosynthesis bifunctional protein
LAPPEPELDPGRGASLLESAARRFPDACRLEERWRGAPQCIVLQIGVGNALPLLATLQRYATSAHAPRQLDLVVVDPRPPDRAALAAALDRLGLATHPLAAVLRNEWPATDPGLHRIGFDARCGLPPGRRARLTLGVGATAALLARLRMPVDGFFMEAVPSGVPGLFALLARQAVPGATLVLGAVGASDREAMAVCGFRPDPIRPDPVTAGQQSATLVARFAPRGPARRIPLETHFGGQRHVAIVGGGLAGCATAAVLADRGWSVSLFDESRSPRAAGGNQPLIADHLHFSPDDNLLARLSRHALWLARPWRAAGRPIGRVQLAASAAEQAAQVRLCDHLGLDRSLLAWLDAGEASDRCGLRLSHGGLWMPGCDAVAPARLCSGWLDSRPGIEWRGGTRVIALDRAEDDDGWHLIDSAGARLARSPVVILAGAGAAPNLAGIRWPPLQRVRGQSTRLRAESLRGLRSILGGGAYACPLGDGETLVGSSFEAAGTLAPDPQADQDNLARLRAMLPGDTALAAPQALRSGGVGWRFATPDRLPMIGAIPDEARIARHHGELSRNDKLPMPLRPGLYGHFALGSRGLLWSILGAEVLASLIDGGAPPLESDLLRAIDPTRFVRQRLRQRLPI